jgi:hypothetical protein
VGGLRQRLAEKVFALAGGFQVNENVITGVSEKESAINQTHPFFCACRVSGERRRVLALDDRRKYLRLDDPSDFHQSTKSIRQSDIQCFRSKVKGRKNVENNFALSSSLNRNTSWQRVSQR